MTRKPKYFHLIYDSGVRGEFCDPITGKPWNRLNWQTIKASMARLAEEAGEHLTIVNDDTGDFATVEPDGTWR